MPGPKDDICRIVGDAVVVSAATEWHIRQLAELFADFDDREFGRCWRRLKQELRERGSTTSAQRRLQTALLY